jgi:hypothetical protein
MIDLSKIPEAERTYDVCLEAVTQDGIALQYMPHCG